MVARTLSEIAIALEPGAWEIGIATAGLLSSSERNAYSEAPSSMRAMSRSRVISPLAPVLTTISPKSSSLCSRPWALIESWRSRPGKPGEAPTTPAAACTFCAWISRTTSPAERPRSATFCGSSHTRIE
jgi:hypothetical protein